MEVPNLGIFNPKEVWYNRIHTSRIGVINIFKGTSINVSDALDQINARLNTSITKSELEDFVLPPADTNDNVNIVLLFNNSSARYYSGDEVTLKPTGGIDVTKKSIGLGNVDNTSDLNKPLSTAQLASMATAKALMEVYVSQQIQLGIGSVQSNEAGLPLWSKLEW